MGRTYIQMGFEFSEEEVEALVAFAYANGFVPPSGMPDTTYWTHVEKEAAIRYSLNRLLVSSVRSAVIADFRSACNREGAMS